MEERGGVEFKGHGSQVKQQFKGMSEVATAYRCRLAVTGGQFPDSFIWWTLVNISGKEMQGVKNSGYVLD